MDIRISLEETGELDRRLHVEFPGAVVEEAIQSRLREMGRNLVLNGYRRGKIPFHVVRDRYGKEVRRQVLQEQLQRACRTAIQQSGLDPAGPARIQQQATAPGEYLSFDAEFDVYPDFTVPESLVFAIQKPVVTITDSDIDELIQRLRRQLARWKPVARPAEMGDRVTLEVVASAPGNPVGEPIPRSVEVVLGAGELDAEAERALTAVSAGALVELDVTRSSILWELAEDSGPVQLRVLVRRVSAVEYPDVDSGFCRQLGMESGDVAALRLAGRDDMRREAPAYETEFVKAQLARQLRELLPLALPKSLVELELARISKATGERERGGDRSVSATATAFRAAAERNVHWAMVVRQIFRQQAMRIMREEINARIDATCRPGEDREARQTYYYEHPEMLDDMEYAVMEGKVVAWLMQLATVTEKPMSFVELAASRYAPGPHSPQS